MLGEECRALMQGFFQRLREKRKAASRKADKQAALMEQVGAAGEQPR